MDPRRQNQNHEYAAGSTSGGGQNYGYNAAQNDPFNTFINTENESAFDTSPWTNQPFQATQQTTTGFGQTSNPWQQTPYQSSSSNFLPLSQFGTFPEDTDPTYSRNSSFQYPGFDSNAEPAFSSALYPDISSYTDLPLSNDPRFDYAGTQGFQTPNETISPRALQNYSQFPQTALDDSTHSQPPRSESAPSQRGSTSGKSITPLTHQDWLNISSRTVKSIDRAGLHIKPTSDLSSATNSKRFDGFIFVGNGSVALNSSKISISRYKKKRSRNEALRFLHGEKGDGPWHHDREPLLKRLKTAAVKQAGPRPATATTQGRGSSAGDSASSSESSDSGSDDESEIYSDSGREEEPEEPSPLPTIRPADPSKALEYDLIKTIWAKRSAPIPGVDIRNALTECWNIFKGVRDRWKEKTTRLQQATEKKDQPNKNAFERRVVEQRRLLESCIRLALNHGHPSIVEKLGENPTLLVVFYQFLADRFKESEYTGSLIASILELMVRCTSIDSTLLETTKMDKVLPRIIKRGDDQGKMLAQKILNNAKVAAEQKASGEHRVSTTQSNGTGVSKPGVDSDEVKKRRTGETKKSALDVNHRAPSAKENPKATTTKTDPKASSKPNTADPSTKGKVNPLPNKSSVFFSSLQSASKKPGTSTKLKEGRNTTETEKKPETPAPAPKPAFSFAATMADLAKQKEAPPVKSEEHRKPETPDEKKKRLRKEQRRKLRVSFKADDELVQIREFVHDPEEELGHEDSQVRDVGDSRGEGQMLKMHKDLEVMDDEDEYEPPEEIEEILVPWIIPHPIDFSGFKNQMDKEELDKIYASRGGPKNIESEERTIQDQREKNTLMVVYPSYSDIPSSPREPSDLEMGDPVSEKGFGSPNELVKNREAEYVAWKNAQIQPRATQTPNIPELLRIMQAQKQAQNQAQQPPQQQPAVMPAPANQLEAIFAKFSTTNQQTHQIPPVQQQPVAPAINLQAILSGIQQPNQPQNYQTQPAYSAAPSAQIPNLQAILAQINNQPTAQAAPMQGTGYNMYPYQQDHERKRQLEDDDGEHGYGIGKRHRGGGQEEKRPFVGKPTIQCKYYSIGKCRKGDECTYLHSDAPS